MMWLKKLAAKRKRKAKVAAEVVSGSIDGGIIPPTSITPLNDVVLARPAARESRGHMGMQGYAPIIKISQNRRYCEYCAERVHGGARHVCWGNVEHHMQTLSNEERIRILAQLAAKPRKLTRKRLRELYAADRLGTAWIEGERYGD